MKKFLPWLSLPFALIILWMIAFSSLPIPPKLDFQIIYRAGMGLERGIPLYDHAGQVRLIAELSGISPDKVILHPFPYPPWYGLIALPLAFFPVSVAARIWFSLNLTMFLGAILLMTAGWSPMRKMITFLSATLFLPVIGTLWVGQYVFPVLFGLALLIFALRQKLPLLIAISAALLTFKPHLGGLILCALAVYLVFQKDDFSRRTLIMLILAGIFLFAIGFLADPAWPVTYLNSLTAYGQITAVQTCNICASLPILLSENDLGLSLYIGGFMTMTILGLLFWKRDLFWRETNFVVVFTLLTLLVSPYLLNYDFLLLLVPLIFSVQYMQNPGDWIILSLVYLIPWIGLGLFGKDGNPSLILSTLLFSGWFYFKVMKVLDLSLSSMYNQRKLRREE